MPASPTDPRWCSPLFVILCLALAGCGVQSETRARRNPIISGAACPETEHPAALAIIFDAMVSYQPPGEEPKTGAVRSSSCAGTLIAPDTVLTASHCLDSSVMFDFPATFSNAKYFVTSQADLTAMVVRPGMTSLPPLPQGIIEVARTVRNPQYSSDDVRNLTGGLGNLRDIGLVFLSRALDLEPAVVITQAEVAQLAHGKPVSMVGWGQQLPPPPNDPSYFPPEGTLGLKVCATSAITAVATHEMLIGTETTARKCKGDSGGPTFMDVQTAAARKQRLIGVTSHAYDPRDCVAGSVDTRVDAWLGWIDSEMKRACDEGVRVACDGPRGLIPPEHYDSPATPDAALPDSDLGVPATDAGATDGGEVSGGCGCALRGGAPARGIAALLGLALLGLALRRGRRRR